MSKSSSNQRILPSSVPTNKQTNLNFLTLLSKKFHMFFGTAQRKVICDSTINNASNTGTYFSYSDEVLVKLAGRYDEAALDCRVVPQVMSVATRYDHDAYWSR